MMHENDFHGRAIAEIGGDDRLNYINSMLAELHGMARSANLVMLAYLIDMAHYEAADEIARREGAGRKR